MTDTERDRLTTDQLAHPQSAERSTTTDEADLAAPSLDRDAELYPDADRNREAQLERDARIERGTPFEPDTSAAMPSSDPVVDPERGAPTITADPALGNDLGLSDDPALGYDPAVSSTQAAGSAGPADEAQSPAQLLDSADLAQINGQWSDIQTAFVDSPQQAVQDADALVAELMQHLAQVFATERQQLEQQWSGGGTVSTEDLRVSLQRYRSFFQRLLSV